MWVSRADEFERKRDTAQTSNPFMLQNEMNNLRSPLKMKNYSATGKNSETSGEPGVIVSLSGVKAPTKSASYPISLSSIDMNLFTAD